MGGAGLTALGWLGGVGNLPSYTRTGMVLAAVGAVFGLVVALHFRFMPTGRLSRVE